LKSRIRTCGIAGAVLGIGAQSAVYFAVTGWLDISLFGPGTVYGAVAGCFAGWLARPLAQHRLDARLKR
jgi:hypothetical protein